MKARLLPVPESWFAALLTANFPLEAGERDKLFALVSELPESLREPNRFARSTWLQMHAFPKDGSIARALSAHGREWMPETGMGVWPDRPAPRLWSSADFSDRNFGEPLPELMYVVFHVAGTNAAMPAWEQTFGSGCSAHMLLNSGADQFHQAGGPLLSDAIEEEAFRNQAFYFPLLDARTLERAGPEDLDRWLPGAFLYVRESIEDKAVLVVARRECVGKLLETYCGLRVG